MIVNYKQARRKARQLLLDAAVTKAPVSVEELVKFCGNVDIRFRPFDGDLSGMVYRHADGSIVIGVNSSHSTNRQRYTIAHELGHVLLHKDEELHVDDGQIIGLRNEVSSKATDPKEIEANTFAAELLMPEGILRSRMAELPQGLEFEDSVTRLAREFQVSPVAMTYRLTNLRLIRGITAD